MFCPVCRDEYRRGFTRCATCDVDLVESLTAVAPAVASAVRGRVEHREHAEHAEATVGPMVPFCGFLTLDEARHAREACRGASLPADILISDSPQGGEEFWLRVRPADVRAVAATIGMDPGVESTEDAVFTCSACGATVRSSDDACPGCGLRFDA